MRSQEAPNLSTRGLLARAIADLEQEPARYRRLLRDLATLIEELVPLLLDVGEPRTARRARAVALGLRGAAVLPRWLRARLTRGALRYV